MVMSTQDDLRPAFDRRMTAAEFSRWYWGVSDLKAACEALALPCSGRKQELRDRVYYALPDAPTAPPEPKIPRRKSTFKWASERLTLETVITDNVSFGPNVRGFFAQEIGRNFVCHGDFMAWVKANVGLTLKDAVAAWHMLEARKDDPAFRREIADCNNYLQYLRDLRDANPLVSLDEARHCWDQKKLRPAAEGRVIYEPSDLRFLTAD
ncbi:MAG: DUF6434 domain-containing protein [Pseudomonadota bacterium]